MENAWINLIIVSLGFVLGFYSAEIIEFLIFIFHTIQSPEKSAKKFLRKLNKAIFDCLLQARYVKDKFFFEKHIHMLKTEFMRAMVRLNADSQKKQQRIQNLSKVYSGIMNYAQLRWRVKDFSELVVCKDELKALAKATDAYLAGADVTDSHLKTAMGNFDDMLQQVLMVSVQEPIVFLLFIGGVREFATH